MKFSISECFGPYFVQIGCSESVLAQTLQCFHENCSIVMKLFFRARFKNKRNFPPFILPVNMDNATVTDNIPFFVQYGEKYLVFVSLYFFPDNYLSYSLF